MLGPEIQGSLRKEIVEAQRAKWKQFCLRFAALATGVFLLSLLVDVKGSPIGFALMTGASTLGAGCWLSYYLAWSAIHKDFKDRLPK